MLNLNGITVRLGGRTILDRATAALPPKARIGLIGRNGAGKSTLMKLIAGGGEADEGSIDMPKAARIGYIAQEAPSGTSTPFETVLEADLERAALLAEEEGLDHSGGDEDAIHKAESPEGGMPVSVFVYKNIPEEGMITGVTYGLSHCPLPAWKLSRPEMIVAVQSLALDWPCSAATVLRVLLSRCQHLLSISKIRNFYPAAMSSPTLGTVRYSTSCALEAEMLCPKLPP